jgi:hypothetical protein
MAGHEPARYRLGEMDLTNCEMKRAIKHWTIAASTGSFHAMHALQLCFENGALGKESIDSTLEAYNNSCVEMRSEARDAYIRATNKQYERLTLTLCVYKLSLFASKYLLH